MKSELATGLAIAVAVALLGGAGWLIKRLITGEKRKEQASDLAAMLDIVHKLKTSGMSMDEAKGMMAEFAKGKMPERDAPRQPDDNIEEFDDEPDQYGTTYGMKMRLGAELDAAAARLKQVLVDLALLLDDREQALLEDAQSNWETHARSEAELSSSAVAGGTLEGVLFLAEMVEQTEKRIEAVNEQTRQRKLMR